jgi:hypothetical protein
MLKVSEMKEEMKDIKDCMACISPLSEKIVTKF